MYLGYIYIYIGFKVSGLGGFPRIRGSILGVPIMRFLCLFTRGRYRYIE